MKKKSQWQEETTIKEVREVTFDTGSVKGFDIQMQNSFGFMMDNRYSVTPKVGDRIQIKTRNFSNMAGVKINGVVLYEKSEEQLDRDHSATVEKMERDKKSEFEKNQAQQDADYEALPPIFKKRIDRLRKNNPDFRWDVEPYILFACKEAVKILKVCFTLEQLKAFHEMPYEEQKKMADIDDGHSGGTMGEAMQLARAYLENPNYVPFIHSSLAHIAGCEKVGCTPPTPEEEEEYGFAKRA